MIIAGVFTAPLFALMSERIYKYTQKTRAANYSKVLMVAFVVLFVVSSLPSFVIKTSEFSEDDVKVLSYLADNIPRGAVIVAPPGYGGLVTAIAKRPTVMDSNFLLVPDAEERYNDVTRVYSTNFHIESVSILDKYFVEYVFLPSNYPRLIYEDSGCLKQESKSGNAVVYYKRSSCRVMQV
jgi:uncharacterized membrane protein